MQVYERAQNYRECGAGITLDVNGMKALRAVDEELFSKFQSTVVTSVNGMQNFDQHGKSSSCLFQARLKIFWSLKPA